MTRMSILTVAKYFHFRRTNMLSTITRAARYSSIYTKSRSSISILFSSYYHTTTFTRNDERNKSDVLDLIMEWRKKYLNKHGKNPSQEDILQDEQGVVLLREWQELEAAEESLEGDVMPLSPKKLQEKEMVQQKLIDWRSKYEQENGNKPSRDELFNDEYANSLFKEYQALTEMEWPADMRLLLTTKID